jgi:hypothetical protein
VTTDHGERGRKGSLRPFFICPQRPVELETPSGEFVESAKLLRDAAGRCLNAIIDIRELILVGASRELHENST